MGVKLNKQLPFNGLKLLLHANNPNSWSRNLFKYPTTFAYYKRQEDMYDNGRLDYYSVGAGSALVANPSSFDKNMVSSGLFGNTPQLLQCFLQGGNDDSVYGMPVTLTDCIRLNDVTPDSVYTFSFWATTPVDDMRVWLDFMVYVGSRYLFASSVPPSIIIPGNKSVRSSYDWKRYSITFKMDETLFPSITDPDWEPNGSTFTFTTINVTGQLSYNWLDDKTATSNPSQIFIDGVQLERGNTATEFNATTNYIFADYHFLSPLTNPNNGAYFKDISGNGNDFVFNIGYDDWGMTEIYKDYFNGISYIQNKTKYNSDYAYIRYRTSSQVYFDLLISDDRFPVNTKITLVTADPDYSGFGTKIEGYVVSKSTANTSVAGTINVTGAYQNVVMNVTSTINWQPGYMGSIDQGVYYPNDPMVRWNVQSYDVGPKSYFSFRPRTIAGPRNDFKVLSFKPSSNVAAPAEGLAGFNFGLSVPATITVSGNLMQQRVFSWNTRDFLTTSNSSAYLWEGDTVRLESAIESPSTICYQGYVDTINVNPTANTTNINIIIEGTNAPLVANTVYSASTSTFLGNTPKQYQLKNINGYNLCSLTNESIKKFDITGGTGYTIITAFRTTNQTSSGWTPPNSLFKFIQDGVAADRGIFCHPGWIDDTLYFDQGGCCDSSQRVYLKNADLKNWHVWAFRSRVYDRSIFKDGVEQTGTAKSTTYAADVSLSVAQVQLVDSELPGWEGDMSFFAVYNTGLGDSDIAKISDFVRSTWV